MSTSGKKIFKIIKDDPWLEPSRDEIAARDDRFRRRLNQIIEENGNLVKFADGYNYFGINYDAKQKGWTYREWAPNAANLFLTGDFNQWDRSSHPLRRTKNGIWEIFLDKKTYKGSFRHGSKIKVVVDSEKGRRDRIPTYIRRVIQDDETKDFSGQVWFPGRFNWEGDNFSIGNLDTLLIYEAHIGMAQEKEGIGLYSEFTSNILPRVKQAGYNTIQLMAIQEHPYYG
ncbi:MAG: 1,4-alpha-glucan-branching enzyme, partial [Bacteroidales bacterium]|nr:1,4-alpha-glucan-branching enzyme [Bacteroidales bacterium]